MAKWNAVQNRESGIGHRIELRLGEIASVMWIYKRLLYKCSYTDQFGTRHKSRVSPSQILRWVCYAQVLVKLERQLERLLSEPGLWRLPITFCIPIVTIAPKLSMQASLGRADSNIVYLSLSSYNTDDLEAIPLPPYQLMISRRPPVVELHLRDCTWGWRYVDQAGNTSSSTYADDVDEDSYR